MIRTARHLAVCLLIFFVFWEWNHPDPIVDLKLLKNRNFGTAVFLQLILGMVLFGSTVLIPQYLQVLLGYTAERAGMVLSPAGFVMMFMMFVAGRTRSARSTRASWSARLHRHRRSALQPHPPRPRHQLRHRHRVAHAPGRRPALHLHPHQHAQLRRRPATKSNQISSLSNFARNLGGSAGTALLTTFLARTAQVHQQQFCVLIDKHPQWPEHPLPLHLPD
jgi:DHA2 family multidrug resistance protein